MVQMQITLPENVMGAIRAEATECGVTPNILTRIRLCMLFSGNGTGEIKKPYVISLENWQEVEAYLKEKYPGWSVGDFVTKAVGIEIKRHPVNPAKKA